MQSGAPTGKRPRVCSPRTRFVFRPIRHRFAAAPRCWLGTFPALQDFEITADEIVGADDLAFVRGRYRLVATAPPGSAPLADQGHYMGLLRKQPDGAWRWTTDMIASELPMNG